MKKIAAVVLLGVTLAGCQTAYVEQPVYVQRPVYYDGYSYPRTYYRPNYYRPNYYQPTPMFGRNCVKTKYYTPNGNYIKKTCS